MRIHSYTVLHYGLDYLPYALRSVYDYCEQLHIIYTPHPSHGHQANVPPIETREELRAATFACDPTQKIHWYDIKNAYQEGKHRDKAVQICKDAGAEMILVVDCDEVWPENTLRLALSHVQNERKAGIWRINFTHLWKSFDWACYDQGWPERILDLRQSGGYADIDTKFGSIYHFGYAVTDKVMRYKWAIHGHKNEMREGWLDNQWKAWPPASDCHPTNERGFWNPEKIDKTKLPLVMHKHPFYNRERIE